MLLQDRTAIVYGGGGSIGSAVARTFAAEGARVYLAGRTPEPVERVAKEIANSGGMASATVLDVFDEQAVTEHAAAVAREAGRLDVSMNLIRVRGLQGVPLIDMAVDDVTTLVHDQLRANFITARAAAKHMVEQGSGVILALNSGSAVGSTMMGSTGPADAALDVLIRNLAAEIGPSGVRVAGIWTAGLPETITREKLAEHGAVVDEEGLRGILANLDQMRMTKRSPRLSEVAGTAAFLASDRAGAITGTFLNVSSGMFTTS
ncbi:SDR family oxidoreductase [Streptomyces sp. NBC_01754]|uniref:SDR family NAD(P)-dependent oxidoreductase n=1 Tax=Streptomyces sp. NBC_01754 TaxID=2975930 RepID=UPI002DD86351|nr:SDR family oxidoreductase [Streptomyces sp. NBC_01754]WSC90941.1 SDR family oxidoreductase [Streptomyces sp. NBC_01754]WSC96565.1 SDR family oxidoreductase [Streptomyces sp. NBC_01754]